jgi:hypothetical protein
MGLFDRRKDAKPEQQAEPPAPTPPSGGPMPVASEVKEMRIREEPKVAAAPPAPPAPPARHAAEPEPEPEVPAAAPAAAPASGTGREIHTVGAGETIADLADRYGVPAEEIVRQNHLPATGEIHRGQVLVITKER